MIHFEIADVTELECSFWLITDDEGNDKDCWVFDTRDALEFKGHLTPDMFIALKEEGLLGKRESVFAAAQFGPTEHEKA